MKPTGQPASIGRAGQGGHSAARRGPPRFCRQDKVLGSVPKSAEKAFQISRLAAASRPVNHESAELSKGTETNRTRAGVPLHTLRRERLTRRHLLEQIEGESPGAQFPLDQDEMVMGRATGAQIRLPSKKASRHHAFLRLRGADYVMVDNDSHNGILLNGVKVHSAVLRDGDVIHVADSVFVYREE